MATKTLRICDGCGDELLPPSQQIPYYVHFGTQHDHDFRNQSWDVCSIECAVKVLTDYQNHAMDHTRETWPAFLRRRDTYFGPG